ncbi:MAG: hypothetical protein KDA91_03400 [Planctomycetaceae bacterium]|nr:hypothetical protein [Planctomycetaceae bacterium]
MTVQTDTQATAPTYKLHSPGGVVWATFLGAPLAAGIVMALNYARAGRGENVWKAIAGGVAASIVLLGLVFAIPDEILDKIPNAVFYVPQLLIVSAVAKKLQGRLVEEHVARGGELVSGWRSAGIGLMCLPLLIGGLLLMEPSFGNVLTAGNDEVYYRGNATEEDAQELADALKTLGFFGGDGASVRLEKESGRTTLSFILINDAWNDAEIVDGFQSIGVSLAGDPLPSNFTMQLCDQTFTAEKTLMIEAMLDQPL